MSKHTNNIINKRGFTLLETLFALAGFFAMLAIVLQVYTSTIQTKNINTMRQVVVQEAHYLTQFLKTALQNYSPDYEEYFARRIMWCWDSGSWYCGTRTQYGNANSIPSADLTNHLLYYCSSDSSSVIQQDVIYIEGILDAWCVDTGYLQLPYYQSYGQYTQQHIDVWADTDGDW